MKYFFLSAMLFVCGISFAQPASKNNVNVDANSTFGTQTLQGIAGNGNGTAFTGGATFYNPKFDREGTVYLFGSWENRARIYAKNNGGAFNTDNINFNAQRSMFESRRNDSIRGWNFANIDKIKVNGREFKSYYFEPLKRNQVFEVIFEDEDFAILKSYSVRILDANPNPMVGRLRDKVIKDENYFIDTKESLVPFKFKKKNILKALGDRADKAQDYAKKYRLSFGKEEDVKKILSFVSREAAE